MRGRPGCPTGQEKNSVGATAGRAPLFYKERLGTGSPPHPPQCAHWGTFPPRGRLWGVGRTLPVRETTLPARPAGGRAVTGVGQMGRRPGKKEGGPPQGPPKPEKVGPGRKNLFLPGVLSSGFLPKKAGPPPGAGRATGRCAPRSRKSPTHPKGTQYRHPTPAAQGPHQTGALFFCAILCNFFAPTVYAGVQLWPRFPRG